MSIFVFSTISSRNVFRNGRQLWLKIVYVYSLSTVDESSVKNNCVVSSVPVDSVVVAKIFRGRKNRKSGIGHPGNASNFFSKIENMAFRAFYYIQLLF